MQEYVCTWSAIASLGTVADVQALNKVAAVRALVNSEVQLCFQNVLQYCCCWIQQQQQQAAVDMAHHAAARWKNRCLRSIMAAAVAGAAQRHTGAASPHSIADAVATGLGLWLPQQACEPLLVASSSGVSSSQALRGLDGISPQQLLLLPLGQRPQPDKSSNRHGRGRFQELVQLCYSDISSMQQHSKQMQVLQQLLLQLLVEQRITSKLTSCLKKLCTALSAVQQRQTTPPQHAAAHALRERCMALYKVLHALTVVSGKRSRTALPHFVQLEHITNAELMLW